MGYNSAGLHYLPPQYKAYPDATILDVQHNTPLEDISAALSLVSLRDGRAPMTGLQSLFGNAVSPLHGVTLQQLQSSLLGTLTQGRRTNQFNVSFTTFGDVVAFGGNSAGNTLARGLMIGGADANEGIYGSLFNLGGHSSWLDITPLRNYSSVEVAVRPTLATLQGQVTSGGDTITWLQGSVPDAFWVGKKCYFGTGIYKVSAIAGNVITVTNPNGSVVSWPATKTDVFRFSIIYGTGVCNVNGTAVTRVSGDPFAFYPQLPSFNFKINGAVVIVNTFPTPDTATLSASAGVLNGAPFEFWFDVNDQFAALRIHGTNVDIENITLLARYDGYWLESQYGGYGKYKDIFVSSGEVSAAVKRQQVSAYADGRVTLGGPFGRQALDIDPTTTATINYLNVAGSPTTIAPVLKARGGDANIGLSIDTKGSGAVSFTSNQFAKIEFQIFGGGGTSWLSVASSATAAPVIAANGAAADIDISLAPKGAGRVFIGPWAGSADAPVNGYILVKDTGGNIRKIPTIA